MRPLPRVAHDSMSLLYQHRLVSSPQLQRLLLPHSAHPQYLNRNLRRLRELGLADRVRAGWGRPNHWFLTPAGTQAVQAHREVLPRPFQMDPLRACGPLHEHMLAVVETGLAFVESARRHGDQCGPFDWTPEVSHPVKDSGERLIADALLHYILITPQERSHAQLFIEVDRATMPIPRLAAKLAGYARYYDYVPGSAAAPGRAPASRATRPAWQSLYPRFPRVLFVFTAGTTARLWRRIEDLAFYVQGLAYLHRAREGFLIGATTLADLQDQGPTSQVWLPLLRPETGRTGFLLTPGND